MKIQRIAPALIALMAVVVTLSVTAGLTRAAPNSGLVGTGTPDSCTDAALNTALIGGGTVTFDCGGPATVTITLKTIAANTTIDGGGDITLTASSSGVQQLFSIGSGIGLTMTNLTIANVPGASYAFPIVNNGRLVLSATSVISTYYFINSTANSSVNIANSTFISNTGTAVSASGPLTVTQSQFLRNTPGSSGLFITYNGVMGTIDNSDFISNSTSNGALLYSNGGAFAVTASRFQQNAGSSALIGAYGPVSIDNSDFISNTTLAVYSTRPLVVSNSRFYWNRASGYASIIYLYGYGWTPALTLTNSSLMSNTAPGGAIYNYYGGTAYISNTQFVSNTSTNSTGALYLDYPGAVQVLSSTFQINTGGCIYANGAVSPLSIADSQFISNTSTGSSAGISVGPVTVTQSSFIGNVASTVGNPHAGALEASRTAYITGSAFINNVGSNGGAMSLSSGGFGPFYDVVANTIIKGNVATANGGGGIRATQYLTLQDSQITDNTAQGNTYGGGLYFANGYVLTVTNMLFQNNVVTGTGGLGGGIYFQGTGGLITDSTVLSNSAGSGGGVYQNTGPLHIVNTLVQSNTARTFFGGGLESHDALTLSEVHVSGNRNLGTGGQGYGGGLYVASFATPVNVNRSLFYNNVASHASSQGGGLYLTSPALITNTTIYSNSAGSGGSGLNYNTSYVITLTNLTILSNTNASGVITSQLNNTGTAYRVTLVNTIVSGGCTGNKVMSLGHNLSNDASCALTGTLDLSNTNPLLGAFADNGGATYSFMPQADSPAVNAGDNARCPSDDQRGVGRPIGAACDIGSIESPHKSPQTITFSAIPNHPVSDPPFVITATASSGLTVTFTSLTTSTCAVSGNVVTPISGGLCTLRASQPGNATYAAAPNVDRSFNVQYLQLIFFNPLLPKVLGDPPFALTAQAGSALPVSYASLTTNVCTVSGITVTLVAGGQCTIRASQAGSAQFAPAPDVDQSFMVLLAQTISFNPIANYAIGNGAFVVTATASSGLTVTFSSQTAGVCTVSVFGLVSPISVGQCTVRASQGGNGVYARATDVDRSFNFLSAQTITFAPIADRLITDPSFTVAPTASSGLTVTVTSLTTSVCTVSNNLVSLVGGGVCTLHASQAGDTAYAPASDVDRSFTIKLHTLFLPLTLR